MYFKLKITNMRDAYLVDFLNSEILSVGHHTVWPVILVGIKVGELV